MAREIEPGIEGLRSMALLQGLSDEELACVYARTQYRRFRRGAVILSAGQHSSEVFFLYTGSVKISTDDKGTNVEDSATILSLIGPGALLGEINALDGQGHSANAVALQLTTCFVLQREAFCQLRAAIPQLLHNVDQHLTAIIRRNSEQICALATQDLVGSIAEHLLMLAAQHGTTLDSGHIVIKVPLTQSLLAQMTGRERGNVARALATLKKQEWIAIDPQHYITILQPKALRDFAARRR